MPVAAPKMTRLKRNPPSEAVYAQYDEHADRYKPARPLPSQARELEMEHLKTPQYTQSIGPRQLPRLAAPQTQQDRRRTPTRHLGSRTMSTLGLSKMKAALPQ